MTNKLKKAQSTPEPQTAKSKELPSDVKKQINQGLPSGRFELVDGKLTPKESK